MLKNCRTKREREDHEKWMSTLTIRQEQVLAAVAFGELVEDVRKFSGHEFRMLRICNSTGQTDVIGIVRTLAKKKLVTWLRTVIVMDPGPKHVLEERVIPVLSEQGEKAIQDRPELWNE